MNTVTSFNTFNDRIDTYYNDKLDELKTELETVDESHNIDTIKGIIEETLDNENGSFEDVSKLADNILKYNATDIHTVMAFMESLANANSPGEVVTSFKNNSINTATLL